MSRPILVGAVIYDPKVALIWDLIQRHFEALECPMDYVFYSNYTMLVDALLAGHVDIAWNSPLAWLDAERRSGGACHAIAMRDTDRDRVSHLVVRRDTGIEHVEDLAGRIVATGALDSPQATLIPLGLLARHGLESGRDFTLRRFDVLVGKHGDHIGGERDALACLVAGEADAAAVLDLNWATWIADGTVDPSRLAVLATTDRFDHCVFTAAAGLSADDEAAWLEALFAMDYDNPAHREMMDLEGLTAWLRGRTSGFAALAEAVDRQRFFA
jgi:ABC-type phosphate/phosphonate transport system substrate-binding protein